MSQGQLKKMKLVAYKDNTFNTKTGDSYEALINPESYSLSYGSASDAQSAQGSGEFLSKFKNRLPQTISFKFLFDATGVIKKDQATTGLAITGVNANPPDLMKDLASFKKVVYDYNGDTHQPPYVQLQWGVLLYNCKLIYMTINFKLFKPDGTPLRAETDCVFEGVIDEKKLAGIENKSSPDLTHRRIVKEGDTLPLLCYREYGDSRYYNQVAMYNGLTDIKKLTPGMNILFPPVITN